MINLERKTYSIVDLGFIKHWNTNPNSDAHKPNWYCHYLDMLYNVNYLLSHFKYIIYIFTKKKKTLGERSYGPCFDQDR